MDVARQHLLAGAGLARDQHRGLGPRHLLGAAHRRLHRRVAHHHRVALTGRGFQDGRDQFRVGRQWQEFARAIADRLRRCFRIVTGATGNDWHRHAFGGQCTHDGAHIMRQFAEHQIEAPIGSQPRQRGVGVVRLVQLGAVRDGDARRLAEFAGKRSDDHDAHAG